MLRGREWFKGNEYYSDRQKKGKVSYSMPFKQFLTSFPFTIKHLPEQSKKKKTDSQSFSANCESIKNTYKKDKNRLFCGVTKLPLHSEINLSLIHMAVWSIFLVSHCETLTILVFE